MIKFLISGFTFFLLCVINSTAQTPNWVWANKCAAGSVNKGVALASDTNGNTFVSGSFSTSITLGSTTLTGSNSAYLCKFNGAGNVQYAVNLATSAIYIVPSVISLDGAGNAIVGGTFLSSVTIGTTTLSSGNWFIAKYDASGTAIWAKSIGGPGNQYLTSISTDINNNIILGGYFTGTYAKIDTNTVYNTGTTLNSAFIAKLTTNGDVTWIEQPNGIASVYGTTTDFNGNIFISGTFNDSLNYSATVVHHTGANITDIFVAKIDSSGNGQWLINTGGDGVEETPLLALDANNNIYLTGAYTISGLTPWVCGNNTLTAGASDLFIAKLDMNGNGRWIKAGIGSGSNGTQIDRANGIAIDANGAICVVGSTASDTLTIDNFKLINTASNFNDIIVLSADSLGNLLFAGNQGGTHSDFGLGITCDGNNFYITGYTQSTSLPFGSTTLSLPGSDNMYIAKIGGLTTQVSAELSKQPELAVYPNPSGGMVTIKATDKITLLEVIDASGSCIYTTKPQSPAIAITLLSNFEKGVYFIKTYFVNGNSSFSKIVFE